MAVLSAEEIQKKLTTVPEWKLVRGEIVREVALKDFVEAMGFVNQVAAKAEAAGHHPDIDIRYNRVRLALISHDAGGLTEKDFRLAGEIETVLVAGSKG